MRKLRATIDFEISDSLFAEAAADNESRRDAWATIMEQLRDALIYECAHDSYENICNNTCMKNYKVEIVQQDPLLFEM